ncbi:dihydropteroate synthase [Pseudochrobactrum sp. sp1633]|uniref:dihydropteroate synthase n=1 Tax=Pseudochrobactrum sp. sp1633 TaxID=3036706 RepID=UPI0025A5F218|nr:dihydropteroate synthase [Pseudochrobactrum sp. sp1633]MDM8344078.1 dihydropteroate synthase [Pseudochrobactrum sp. sp1633]HWD12052.1 dihydropteroate synthase [Pseudochrobactrum sp.]
MKREWRLAHSRTLETGAQALIMGILNITPDSFSDGGSHQTLDAAISSARIMLDAGAVIIDVGGESTRPDAALVTAQQEQDRVLPVIEALARETGCLISIDTYRAQTAKLAVEAGAHIVNDVWGLQKEPDIANLAAKTGAGLVIMHTGRDRDVAADVIEDQHVFLQRSLEIAAAAGVDPQQIMLDPGFGFAKDTQQNVELMARFGELQNFGLPWLVGTSRKRFTGAVTGREIAAERDAATAATSAMLRLNGADIFRVHNVALNRDALAMADAVLNPGALQKKA